MVMKYSIYAALREDINSGWVWVNTPKLKQRSVVCIKNLNSGKKIYCEILQIDKSFEKYYNTKDEGRITIKQGSPTLVLNEWYRTKLGDIQTKSAYELEISEADDWRGKVFSCIQHPQVSIRIASWLGIISVALGVVGVIFGIISLFK